MNTDKTYCENQCDYIRHLLLGCVKDDTLYLDGQYTKTESDARYALKSVEDDVEEMQTEIAAKASQTDLANLSGTVSNIQATVSDFSNQIAEVSEEVSGLSDAVELQSQIESLHTESGAGRVFKSGANGRIFSEEAKNAFNREFEDNPLVIQENGTASAGTSSMIPRADHVHPHDSSKVDVSVYTEKISSLDSSVESLENSVSGKVDVSTYTEKIGQIDSDLQKVETLADIDNSLIPYYKGDLYMEYNYVPSSFYFNGDFLYILCFSRVSNTGRVYKINFTTNTIVDKFTAKIYHANSCATCNNKVFIAKGASQVEGESASGIIIADTSLQNMRTIGSDIGTFQSVSYDEVTNKLYAYRNNGSLYEINPATESIEFIEQINVPNIGHYNQDFCIRDGIAMISSWYKEFIIVDISTTEVIGSGCMPAETGEKYFILDESEGWEWHNGNLYCVMYSKKRNVDSFCTFTMLGVGQTVISRPSSAIQSGNFTVSITDEARTKFANNEFTFKHPNQLMITTQKYNAIKIDTTENLGDVYLSDSVEILGNLVCDTLIAKCADLTFNPSTGSVVSIGSLQSPNNGGSITFGGNNFEYDIESATFGYSVVMLKIRSGTSFTNPSVFGSKLVVPLKRSITLLSSVPDMIPLQRKATNITIEASGSKTIEVPFNLPNSYWAYRAIAISENVNIIAACDETRIDDTHAKATVYLRNTASESKTFAVNVFLIPNYNRTGDADDVIDFSEEVENGE